MPESALGILQERAGEEKKGAGGKAAVARTALGIVHRHTKTLPNFRVHPCSILFYFRKQPPLCSPNSLWEPRFPFFASM